MAKNNAEGRETFGMNRTPNLLLKIWGEGGRRGCYRNQCICRDKSAETQFSSVQFSSVPQPDTRPVATGVFRNIMAEIIKKCLSVLLMAVWVTVVVVWVTVVVVWVTVVVVQNCLASEPHVYHQSYKILLLGSHLESV